jgi:hypothetical protein
MELLAPSIIDPVTYPEGAGNMCRACAPRPSSPPRPLMLRLGLLRVALVARLRIAFALAYFLVCRLVKGRAFATQCRAVPMLTGGPDLLGWRSPVAVGMAFVAREGEVSINPQPVNLPVRKGKACLSEHELLRRRLAHRYPLTTVRIDMRGGWVISTAGRLARVWGGR